MRADARRAEGRVARADFVFYDGTNGGPYRYVEINPAEIGKLVRALKGSMRRDELPERNFGATAMMDTVTLIDSHGERIATARVPGSAYEWHGPNYAAVYRDAKSKAR